MENKKTIEVHFIPRIGTERDLAKAAILSAVPDHSAESHAIFSKAFMITRAICLPKESHLISPSDDDSLSGVDFKNTKIRKGRLERIENWLQECGGVTHQEIRAIVAEVEKRGHRAVVVADEQTELGVIELVC
jgi:K+-transporting ATPase ATPase B chain